MQLISVVIDGVLTEKADANISIFDRGFLYGDGVSEMIRARGLRLFDAPAHYERLLRSLTAARMRSIDVGALRSATELALSALTALAPAHETDAAVRLMITRGEAGLELDRKAGGAASNDVPPKVIVIAREIAPPESSVQPVRVARAEAPFSGPRGIKALGYLPSIVERAVARERGFDDALWVDAAGDVICGATSNVLAVKSGVVVAPVASALLGVTRAHVLALARADGIRVDERALSWEELTSAEEVFLTSSIRGVAPVAAVEDRVYDAPGPVTKSLAAAYFAVLSRALTSA